MDLFDQRGMLIEVTQDFVAAEIRHLQQRAQRVSGLLRQHHDEIAIAKRHGYHAVITKIIWFFRTVML